MKKINGQTATTAVDGIIHRIECQKQMERVSDIGPMTQQGGQA